MKRGKSFLKAVSSTIIGFPDVDKKGIDAYLIFDYNQLNTTEYSQEIGNTPFFYA